MHIPDGMLSNTTVAVTGVTAAGYVGYAVAWVRKQFDQRKIVLMAVIAALVFALQMLNFPVAAGTSGHFTGGAMAAILLGGPFPAAIVLTTVLIVQAVIFADGGILALGANVVNMAIVAPLVGWGVWILVNRLSDSKVAKTIGAFVAAWLSLVVSSLVASVEIWVSGNAQLGVVAGAMGFWHALIGIGEGLITAGLVMYVLQVRPDLLSGKSLKRDLPVKGLVIGMGALALFAAGISFLASGYPDGLEFVYFEQGVGNAFQEMSLVNSPIPDYVIPGMSNETLAGILAGIVGVIVTGVLLYAVIGAIRKRGEQHPGNA